MYDKKQDNQYIANTEIIFQILDKKDNIEVNRQRLDLEFSKDNFRETRFNNIKEGEIEFILDNDSYFLHLQLIDLKSKLYWTKKIDINKESIQSTLSNLHLYYMDTGESFHLTNETYKDIKQFNCQFHYIHKNRDIQNLDLFLLNINDTLYHREIPISQDSNNYDIIIDVPDNINGKIIFQISDGIQKREKEITIHNLDQQDFWSNDMTMIKGIMYYVLPYEEYKKIKAMNDGSTVIFLKDYWSKLDPDKETEINELLEEFNVRVQYVNLEFKELSRQGWKTDRGKIFIIHGKPKSNTSEYNPNTNTNRLIWTYESGKIFIFEDRGSFGHYYLVNQAF